MASLSDLAGFGTAALFGAEPYARGVDQRQNWDAQKSRNRLLELTAENRPTEISNQNRLTELAIQKGEQGITLGEQEIDTGALSGEIGNARVFVGALGQDFEQLDPATQQRQWSAARQQLIGIDPSNEDMPEQFNPGAYRMVRGLANLGNQGNTNVQSTFRTDDGRLGYVTRDGRTVVTDQKVEGKFQARDYGDRPYVFNPRSGTFERVVGPDGDAAVSDADRSRYADAEADIYAARKSAEAVAGVRSEQEQREQSEQAGNTLSMLDEMEAIATSDEGYYTGNLMDRGVAAMRMAGINLNDERAANTIALKQYATRLKFAAKPPGLGQMTDAEWRIIRDAIPDPATASAEELLAGVRTMRRMIQIKSGRQPQSEARSQDDQPAGQPRMRYNPETRELEPVR